MFKLYVLQANHSIKIVNIELFYFMENTGHFDMVISSMIINFSDAPHVTVSPQVKVVVEGSNLNLTSAASGQPKPSIKCTKAGSSDSLSNASLLTVVNETRPRTANSRVQYQCIASNGVGTPTLATASITVNCNYVGKTVVHYALLFNFEYFSSF